MSKIYNVGPTWKGFLSIGRLIIFGDSYSSVEFANHDPKKPTAVDPLGLPFPGNDIWNELDKPNWVGHLITKFRAGPRYVPNKTPGVAGNLGDQDQSWIENPLLVHDYARGGDTVEGVRRQIETLFLPGLAKNDEVKWKAAEALFVTWIGINDCGYGAKDDVMANLFRFQEKLYAAGARNFLFIDVPPIQRSPAGMFIVCSIQFSVSRESNTATVMDKWNANLREATENFSDAHKEASVFLYSSYTRFNALLDDPATFGFKLADIKKRNGTFWIDHIHPTSLVHEHIASDVAAFLAEIPASGENDVY